MKLKFSQQILEKYSNIRFNEKLSSGRQVASCEQRGRQAGRQAGRQTDGHL
jgi:hypothetical protein